MNPYSLLKPLLFRLPPETAHNMAQMGLRGIQSTPLNQVLADYFTIVDHRLTVDAFGTRFHNPVGVAAGFDKNAKIPVGLSSLGFGHVEIGAVTAKPQAGNPRPRMFRLPEDEAIINRMGFNNDGADIIGDRLRYHQCPVPVGVNIGKSKVTPAEDAPDDYLYSYQQVKDGGDYFVVNVSSPNTPGLRDLQQREALEDILDKLINADAKPLLVKLSPDLSDPATEEAISVINDRDIDGIIATNTTSTRPDYLKNQYRSEEGGLSGKPLQSKSTRMIKFVAKRTDRPIIGVGGISNAREAYEKIRNGASLVQLYTGLIYEGPGIAKRINSGLLHYLDRDGFESVEQAVGVDVE